MALLSATVALASNIVMCSACRQRQANIFVQVKLLGSTLKSGAPFLVKTRVENSKESRDKFTEQPL